MDDKKHYERFELKENTMSEELNGVKESVYAWQRAEKVMNDYSKIEYNSEDSACKVVTEFDAHSCESSQM